MVFGGPLPRLTRRTTASSALRHAACARGWRYYADVGSADPVRITLAPGSYVPSVSYSGDYPGASAAASDTRLSYGLPKINPCSRSVLNCSASWLGFEASIRRTNSVAGGPSQTAVTRSRSYVRALCPEATTLGCRCDRCQRTGRTGSARSATALALLDLTASRRSVIGLGRALGYSLLTAGLEMDGVN